MTAYDDAQAAMADAASHHMLREINSTQAQCDCGVTFPLSANPHILSGEMMWHLRDVMLDALLAAKQTQTCPRCGGRSCVQIVHGENGIEDVPCPGCSAGVVVGTEPLIMLAPEQAGWIHPRGWFVALDDATNQPSESCVAVYRRRSSDV